ncbi:MAG: hypothetical protein QOD67_2595 [Caballeronia sp.]|jgi:hypothetical protein|nr:hypothetical protein [Caballeronia sp.]
MPPLGIPLSAKPGKSGVAVVSMFAGMPEWSGGIRG